MGNRRLSCLLKPLLRRGWGGLGAFWAGLVLLLLALPLSAQTAFVWQAGAQAFFDNEEYARSAVQSPQTMAGVHLAPQVGVSWQGRHRVFAGVDALKEFGTDRVIDRADLMAYYEFESPAFHFRMGAFPRRDVLGRYPGLDHVELRVEAASGDVMRMELPCRIDARNMVLLAEMTDLVGRRGKVLVA